MTHFQAFCHGPPMLPMLMPARDRSLRPSLAGFACSVYAAVAFPLGASDLCAHADVRDAPWCDFSLPFPSRAAAIVANLTAEEKAGLFLNDAAAIPRVRWPSYSWWSEVGVRPPVARPLAPNFLEPPKGLTEGMDHGATLEGGARLGRAQSVAARSCCIRWLAGEWAVGRARARARGGAGGARAAHGQRAARAAGGRARRRCWRRIGSPRWQRAGCARRGRRLARGARGRRAAFARAASGERRASDAAACGRGRRAARLARDAGGVSRTTQKRRARRAQRDGARPHERRAEVPVPLLPISRPLRRLRHVFGQRSLFVAGGPPRNRSEIVAVFSLCGFYWGGFPAAGLFRRCSLRPGTEGLVRSPSALRGPCSPGFRFNCVRFG